MKYLLFFLLLLPTSGLVSETNSLPLELYLRPWWKAGEVSFLGIFEPEEKTRSGLILQIPVVLPKGEEFRLLFLRTNRDREGKFLQTISLGYRSPYFHPVGFQIRLGGSPETFGGAYVSLGIYGNQGSLECFGRKSLEEKSFGLLLRSGFLAEPNLSIGFERIQTLHFPNEDRLSFGVVWSFSFFVGDVALKEETKNLSGYTAIGVSPFEWKQPEETIKPTPPKKEKPIPILFPEELLKLGFSVSESILISSGSRKDPESFKNLLLGLSEGKRKKIRGLLRKKAGSPK